MLYDYLIVGHGLAGAVLSQRLLAEGSSIVVIDHPEFNSASKVAGGLYNPITGRKMVKTWNADKLFPILEPFYSDLEKILQTRLLYDVGIYRPFLNVEEQNEWQGKAASKTFAPYIENIFMDSQMHFHLNDPFGGLLLKKAGYVDTKRLIECNKKFLVNKGVYQQIVFNEDQLEDNGNFLSFNGLRCKRIIFCKGYNTYQPDYFDWLPFRPVKGEIATMTVNDKIETIANRGIFILPTKNGRSRAGSTYNWKEVDNEPSLAGRQELEEKLKGLYQGKYEIIGLDAGIRPATKDRRPFIGLHPKNKKMGIFNGFGSKGVSLIPYYSQHFINHLMRGDGLDAEVDICRYF